MESTLNLLQRYGGRDYKAYKLPAHGFLLLNLITVCANKHSSAHAHFCEIMCQTILKGSCCLEVTTVSAMIRGRYRLTENKIRVVRGRRSAVTFNVPLNAVKYHFSVRDILTWGYRGDGWMGGWI